MSKETSTINWAAAERVAERLGVHTRELVAQQDPEAVSGWALTMSRPHDGSDYNAQRSSFLPRVGGARRGRP